MHLDIEAVWKKNKTDKKACRFTDDPYILKIA